MLRRLGGLGTRAQLVGIVGRRDVDAALASGRVVAVARGRYALPTLEADLRTAHQLSGVLSYTSAALQHGWAVLRMPEGPHVTVPRGRNVDRDRARGVTLHRGLLHPDDVSGTVTSQARTAADCLKGLPFDEALAVADSVLRAGRSPQWLRAVTEQVRGPGAVQARRVAREASEAAANPFESGLRAISLGVVGLRVRPQVPLHSDAGVFLGRPDLVDTDLKIVAEADSFAWHGSRSALVRDARRYNAMAVHGWLVLRFTWEDVVLKPHGVREVLEHAVDERQHLRSRRSSRARRAKGVVGLRNPAG